MQNPPPHFGRNFTKTLHTQPSPSIDPAKVTLPDGYTVLISGASRGIGEYISYAYAHAKASNIIITARNANDLEAVKARLEQIGKEQGRSIDVTVFSADSSKQQTFVDLKKLIETRYAGRLDCLVNNAGIIGSLQGFNSKLHMTDPDEHFKLYDLNYMAAMYSMIHLIPLMLAPPSAGKTIINISSMAAHGTSNGPIAYSASKLALNRLTQHVGENYKDAVLVCIALHPGGVKSPGAKDAPPHMQAILVDDITLCGAFCVWLSKEQRPWASGRFLSVEWDADELEGMKDEIVNGDKLKFRMVV